MVHSDVLNFEEVKLIYHDLLLQEGKTLVDTFSKGSHTTLCIELIA